MKRVIIISGINLVDGGTFTIMKECLDAITVSPISKKFRVIALISKKELFPSYDNIEMLEYPKSKKHYLLRFYYEYYKFREVSKKYNPRLWLSLHDMSPIVEADVQAVYMHNPSPFLGRPKSISFRGLGFSSLYKYIYRINIHSNKYLIVQQNWLRESFSEMFNFPKDRIIVARPKKAEKANLYVYGVKERKNKNLKVFVYASYPRGFKNFELICEASSLLYKKGIRDFEVRLTLNGSENDYAKNLVEKYSYIDNIKFLGLIKHELINDFYEDSDCMIFPSKAETWGLPITEYGQYNKPMILADLPYAHETAAGLNYVTFVESNSPLLLSERMKMVIDGDLSCFSTVEKMELAQPFTESWNEMFNLLLK